jgi:hypothetical protein
MQERTERYDTHQGSLRETSKANPGIKIHGSDGLIYLAAGALLIVWPGMAQTVFMEAAFVGHGEGRIRMVGLTVVVIGWLYVFGGRSHARQFVAASVVDRLVFVPGVLVPLATAGVFPRLLVTFAALDPILAIGAWVLRDGKG